MGDVDKLIDQAAGYQACQDVMFEKQPNDESDTTRSSKDTCDTYSSDFVISPRTPDNAGLRRASLSNAARDGATEMSAIRRRRSLQRLSVNVPESTNTPISPPSERRDCRFKRLEPQMV
jgi:hypothetical protein